MTKYFLLRVFYQPFNAQAVAAFDDLAEAEEAYCRWRSMDALATTFYYVVTEVIISQEEN